MSKLKVLVLVANDPPQYARDGKLITAALERAGCQVTHTTDANALNALGGQQVVVLYTFGDYLNDRQVESLAAFVRNGGGLVGVHTAIATSPSNETLGKLLGARIVTGKIVEHKLAVSDPDHPIAHRVQDFKLDDEFYITTPKSDFRTFLTTKWGGEVYPMAWTRDEGRGKVVYLGNGHTPGAFLDPTFQKLLSRSVRFAAGEDWSARTIKCAAVGYGGQFGMAKLHLQSAEKARMKAVAVCDIDPARLPAAKAELGERIATFSHIDALLKESDCELVQIITPHDTHAPLSIQSLEAGRHVVTEKPYTVNVEEATRVIETARRVGKMATVFHNRRWDGDFLAIKRIVESGRIGEVFHIECGFGGFNEPRDWWRSFKDRSGGSFFDWGAHYIDWVLQLMPHKIESISGEFKKIKWHHVSNEDYTSAMVRFEGGRSALIEQGSVNAIPKANWRVLGTKGGIEKAPWLYDGKDFLRVVSVEDGQKIESKVPALKSDWDGFYRNVADHLLLGEELAVTPESARNVIAVMSLAEESSRQGGTPVKLPY